MKYLILTKQLSAFILLLAATFFSCRQIQAQSTSLSPFSRFGLGDIHNQTFAEQAGNGLSVTSIDPFAINVANPASYAFLARPTFTLGARVDLLNLSNANQSQFIQNNTINNVVLGVPLAKNKLGIAFGVMPFSSIGYSIVDNTSIAQIDQQVSYEYTGDGGLSRTFLGGGYKLIEKVDTFGNRTVLSAGLNASFIFGRLEEERKAVFPQGYGGFNLSVADKYRVSDFLLDLGVNYAHNIKKITENNAAHTKLVVGASFRIPQNLNIKGSRLAESYSLNPNTSIETARDTISYRAFENGKVLLPMAFQVGGGLDIINENFRKIFIGLEYRFENWSSYSNDVQPGNDFSDLTNSHRIVLGTEYMPTTKTSRKVFEKISYRMGVRYEQTFLKLNNEQLESYGISFGLGVPISLKRPHSPSTFNIGVELGQRGTTANNLLKEDLVRISVGLTLMPHFRQGWFVQRKYD
jgi:hypothetical protein